MKISYLAISKIPSKEANSVHVMRMCQALSNKGVDVQLVVPKPVQIIDDPYTFYGVNNNFKIIYKQWRKITLGVYVFSLRVLRFLLKDKKQCVYGRHLTSCFFSAMFGFNTIWESHTPVDYMGRLFVWQFKLMMRQNSLKKLVVISTTLREYYIKNFNINPGRIEVLPDCSNEVDIDAIKKIAIDTTGYKASVGYIGQLYPGKGMEILSELIIRCPDVVFHIVGGKDDDISRWKNKLSNCKNVIFYGFVNPSETPSYGASMDILIAPYLNKVQGAGTNNYKKNLAQWMSPLKIFEYMSYKKPIITSDLPVLHDVLNSDNSVMCNPEVIEDWVAAINLLSSDKNKADSIANQAYNDFIHNYTWDIRAKKIINLFK